MTHGPAGHLVRNDGEASPAPSLTSSAPIPTSQTSAPFMHGRQPGVPLRAHEAARASATHSVDEIIDDLRPKVAAVPGIMTFMQNPPPITVSGQRTASAYQMTLQSVNLTGDL